MTIATISSEAASFLQMPEDIEFSSILSEMFSDDHQPVVQENIVQIVKSSCNSCGGVVVAKQKPFITAAVSSPSRSESSKFSTVARMVSDYSLVSDDSDSDETSSQKVVPQSSGVSLNASVSAIHKTEQNASPTSNVGANSASAASVPTSPVGSKKRTASEADLSTCGVEGGETTQKVQRR